MFPQHGVIDSDPERGARAPSSGSAGAVSPDGAAASSCAMCSGRILESSIESKMPMRRVGARFCPAEDEVGLKARAGGVGCGGPRSGVQWKSWLMDRKF